MSDTTSRTDDLKETLAKVAEHLRGKSHGFVGGWLDPVAAFSFYWQNGTIRQIVNRMTTLMTKSGWDYTKADVKGFNWSTVESRLETKRIKSMIRLGATWALVFGGGAIEHITDDVSLAGEGRMTKRDPLELKNVREYMGMRVWSAYELRPEPGKNYHSAEYFYPYARFGQGELYIHRSRLSLMVPLDVPVEAGFGTSKFINSLTGWPPSWLEGFYETFCDWRGAHRDVSTIVHSKSLLHLMLEGFEKVWTSPDSPEAQALLGALEQIAADLNNNGLLVTDTKSRLEEIERSTAGLSDLLERKALAFTSSTGWPKELVIMEAEGNLGTNSAPIDAAYDLVDGFRQEMGTPVIERATDIELAAQRRESLHAQEPVDTPSEYTVEHRPIATETKKERSEARKNNAAARKADVDSGVPVDAVLSDPELDRDYPDLAPLLEDRRSKAAAAAAAAAESEADDPEGEDMVSAAEVARRLNLSSSTVIKMAKAGSIPGRPVAGRWKFYWSKVLAAIKGDGVLDGMVARVADAGIGLSTSEKFGEVYGASLAMREIFAVLERVADEDLAVLLLGETGTGKEGVARGLHRGGEFVAVNCAALPDEVEELAEHVQRELERAAGGTLFLDEVGDLSPAGQAALLRGLAGDVGARLVSATSLDIRQRWAFRPDLYYRLAVVEVEVPPLRDREEDILVLAEMFYKGLASERGMEPADPAFTEAAEAAMMLYKWPGNVRELRSAVIRGMVLADAGSPIGPEHLQLRMSSRE